MWPPELDALMIVLPFPGVFVMPGPVVPVSFRARRRWLHALLGAGFGLTAGGAAIAEDDAARAARAASPPLKRRLRALDQALEDGVLTRAEYDSKRAALLDPEGKPPGGAGAQTEPPPEPASAARAVLGVATRDVDPADIELLRVDRGALVGDVVPGSPAAAAGLKAGDVVTAFDDQPVTDAKGLVAFVASRRPGDRVTLRVVRRWQPVVVAVELGGAGVRKP
jgi:membrane-associated protease RseP (regulator of RpoE activity)